MHLNQIKLGGATTTSVPDQAVAESLDKRKEVLNPNCNLSLNVELNQHNAQSSQTSADINLNIVLPLEASEDVSKFLAEMNGIEEFQKQAAQSYEVRSWTLPLSIIEIEAFYVCNT